MPPNLPRAHNNQEFFDLLARGQREIVVLGGDICRTVGGKGVAKKAVTRKGHIQRMERQWRDSWEATRLPIDILEVSFTRRGVTEVEKCLATAHVALRLPNRSGGWARGAISLAMNAQFMGRREVVARGHPNDGRCDVVEIESDMHFRQRLIAAHRARNGSHIPHPKIAVRSKVSVTWSDQKRSLWIDGGSRGPCSMVSVEVLADHAVIWIL